MNRLGWTQIYAKAKRIRLTFEQRRMFIKGIEWAEKMHRIETLERKREITL